MAKHSTLTNADDLHYAKARIFSGAPSSITPDFVGEILVDGATAKIYLGAGISQGQIVELSPQGADGGTGGGTSPAFAEIEAAYPQNFPLGVGQLYFDLNSMRMFIAAEVNPLAWLPIDGKPILNLTFADNSIDSSGSSISVTYTESTFPNPDNVFNYYFFGGEFSDLANSETKNVIRRKGCGIYKFEFYVDADPNLYLEFSGSAVNCNFYTYSQDRKAFLVIPDFAITSPDATANFTLNLRSN